MQIPNGLMIFLAVLIIGFVLSVMRTKRAKLMRIQYEKIGDASNGANGISYPKANEATMITSYQDPAAVYAIPSANKKDVTYCVIDGRLVDES